MLQKNRPEDALQCLRTLLKINYTQSRTKNMQLQAGALTARKDHDVNATAKPSVMILSYTGNSKLFVFFKTAYIRTWKSLNKKSSPSERWSQILLFIFFIILHYVFHHLKSNRLPAESFDMDHHPDDCRFIFEKYQTLSAPSKLGL